MTQSGRLPGRSILLTTTIGLSPCCRAFWVTKRVCGIGPSTAAFAQLGAFVKGAGLLQQLVHEGGLAMVNVGDNRNIAQFFDHKGVPVLLAGDERRAIIEESAVQGWFQFRLFSASCCSMLRSSWTCR